MEQHIKTTIEAYVENLSKQDIHLLDTLLHSAFTVVLHQGEDVYTTSMITKTRYLEMIAGNIAGGDSYQIENLIIRYMGPTATAEYTLQGSATQMHVFLQLVQKNDNDWLILSNMPVITQCPHASRGDFRSVTGFFKDDISH